MDDRALPANNGLCKAMKCNATLVGSCNERLRLSRLRCINASRFRVGIHAPEGAEQSHTGNLAVGACNYLAKRSLQRDTFERIISSPEWLFRVKENSESHDDGLG